MVDRNLMDLFGLYRATRWQKLVLLRTPSALPFFLAGLRVSGGLSLIGAVTAEMVVGAGGWDSGLASRMMEGSFRMDIPRMYAALALLVASGVLIHVLCVGLAVLLLGPRRAALVSKAS
ncbi:MAG: ABC transporter permease subunit [Burkholderiaceae bacterium]|nr:ABC transporter permease subunit [Burkholderiaceae bacterium]